MGILDLIKNKLNSNKKPRDEEFNSYLLGARNNMKLTSEYITRFLDSVKDFQPAKRHEELYHIEVRNRLLAIKSGLHKGMVFIDEKTNNEINTMNPIRSPSQLREMVETWIKHIKTDDEKVYDILKILQVEMWSEEKIRRGFPAPQNKEIICGYLSSAANYLTEARNHIDNYVSMVSAPQA